MKKTSQIRREAKKLYRMCIVNGVLDEDRARLVVQQVINRKNRGYFKLLSTFQRLVKLDREAHTAKVETAAPLPSDFEARVRDRLADVYGSSTSIHFAVKPALIGGMRIQVGSDVYDGSVESALEGLKGAFERSEPTRSSTETHRHAKGAWR